jgi:PhnB protein
MQCFYKKTSIEKSRLLMPNGKIGHAEIEIEGSLLMMADENLDWGNKSPETIGGNGLFVICNRCRQCLSKAIDAGAISVCQLKTCFMESRGPCDGPYGSNG